ncbi:MAG TPA: DUF6153 family protein [Pilimelia sp.]|nr:DUF6153 family protein [Pilimelia sp.]
MTRTPSGPTHPRRAGRHRATMLIIIMAVVGGLVWMHALSDGHGDAGNGGVRHGSADTPRTAHASVLAAGPGGEDHRDTSPCPADRSGHPGPMCQSGAVPAGIAPAPPNAPAVALPPPTRSTPSLARTTAADAGAGTGCGPPSLTLLSISRT